MGLTTGMVILLLQGYTATYSPNDTRGIFLVCTLDVVAPPSSSASSSKVLAAAIAAPVSVVVALAADRMRHHIVEARGRAAPHHIF